MSVIERIKNVINAGENRKSQEVSKLQDEKDLRLGKLTTQLLEKEITREEFMELSKGLGRPNLTRMANNLVRRPFLKKIFT